MIDGQPVEAAELLAEIQQFDTCRIANAIETLGVRLRNEGYTSPGLKSLCGGEWSAIGYAATVRFKSSDTPLAGVPVSDSTDWWGHVVAIPTPRIAVLEDLDNSPGRGSFVGEMHCEVLRALGCAGVITNGSARDLPAIRAMRFPIFARHIAVSHSYVHPIDYGKPVRILDLTVCPGDLIYADCHGAISIPCGIAHRLPGVAARQATRERRVIDLCRSGNFTLETLRAEVRDKP